jgi:hypothetical protein
MLYDAQRASTVDTSDVGVLASMMLNSGCVPSVRRNMAVASIGLIPQPAGKKWQVPQERPFVP